MTESDDSDRLIALSDSWELRSTSSGGGGRWSHRELSDDRVATVHADDNNSNHHHHHHAPSSRPRRPRGDDSRDSSASPVVGGGSKQRGSSRASPVIITKDSSSCGEMPSQRSRDALDVVEFSRGSAERFSLRGARNALRRGVDNLIGRRTPTPSAALNRKHPQMNGSSGRLEIGDPIPVTSEALQRKMERLGCVDLLTVDQFDGGVRRPHSSDSLLPGPREVSPGRLSVQLDSTRTTPESVERSSVSVAPTSDDWNRYFQSCFCDMLDDPAVLPTVVTTCVDESVNASRQTELDHILDEIVRDIDLLDQTLADSSGE